MPPLIVREDKQPSRARSKRERRESTSRRPSVTHLPIFGVSSVGCLTLDPPNLEVGFACFRNPAMNTSTLNEPWQFWIDVGGTFTDCIARRPDGTLLRHKLELRHRVLRSIATTWPSLISGKPVIQLNQHLSNSVGLSALRGIEHGKDRMKTVMRRTGRVRLSSYRRADTIKACFNADDPARNGSSRLARPAVVGCALSAFASSSTAKGEPSVVESVHRRARRPRP